MVSFLHLDEGVAAICDLGDRVGFDLHSPRVGIVIGGIEIVEGRSDDGVGVSCEELPEGLTRCEPAFVGVEGDDPASPRQPGHPTEPGHLRPLVKGFGGVAQDGDR